MRSRHIWLCRGCRRHTGDRCPRCSAPLCRRCAGNQARHGKAKTVKAKPNNLGIEFVAEWSECNGAAS